MHSTTQQAFYYTTSTLLHNSNYTGLQSLQLGAFGVFFINLMFRKTLVGNEAVEWGTTQFYEAKTDEEYLRPYLGTDLPS